MPQMNLIEFQRKFATEKACQDYLFHLRWPNNYQCPRCNHKKASFHTIRHLYQCKSCKYQVSLTAMTIFHKTRIPLKKWFWMIFLMSHQKNRPSILSLQKMLGIKNYKTAWLMSNKIQKALIGQDAYDKLVGLI